MSKKRKAESSLEEKTFKICRLINRGVGVMSKLNIPREYLDVIECYDGRQGWVPRVGKRLRVFEEKSLDFLSHLDDRFMVRLVALCYFLRVYELTKLAALELAFRLQKMANPMNFLLGGEAVEIKECQVPVLVCEKFPVLITESLSVDFPGMILKWMNAWFAPDMNELNHVLCRGLPYDSKVFVGTESAMMFTLERLVMRAFTTWNTPDFELHMVDDEGTALILKRVVSKISCPSRVGDCYEFFLGLGFVRCAQVCWDARSSRHVANAVDPFRNCFNLWMVYGLKMETLEYMKNMEVDFKRKEFLVGFIQGLANTDTCISEIVCLGAKLFQSDVDVSVQDLYQAVLDDNVDKVKEFVAAETGEWLLGGSFFDMMLTRPLHSWVMKLATAMKSTKVCAFCFDQIPK